MSETLSKERSIPTNLTIWTKLRPTSLKLKKGVHMRLLNSQQQDASKTKLQETKESRLYNPSVWQHKLLYSGKFSRVQIFAKIPFPLQKKFSRF